MLGKQSAQCVLRWTNKVAGVWQGGAVLAEAQEEEEGGGRGLGAKSGGINFFNINTVLALGGSGLGACRRGGAGSR